MKLKNRLTEQFQTFSNMMLFSNPKTQAKRSKLSRCRSLKTLSNVLVDVGFFSRNSREILYNKLLRQEQFIFGLILKNHFNGGLVKNENLLNSFLMLNSNCFLKTKFQFNVGQKGSKKEILMNNILFGGHAKLDSWTSYLMQVENIDNVINSYVFVPYSSFYTEKATDIVITSFIRALESRDQLLNIRLLNLFYLVFGRTGVTNLSVDNI